MSFNLVLLFGAIALVSALIWLLISSILRPRKYPPGPNWLPIVGNTPAIRRLSRKLGGQHNALTYLANLYNTKILGLKLGKEYIVVVFGETLIRDVYTRDEFLTRPDSFFIRLRSMGTRKGITMTDGPFWEEQRSFAVRHLRDLGFGKTLMEDLIMEEFQELVKKVGDGGEIEWSKLLAPSALNVLWALTAGSRFKLDDPRLAALLHLMDERAKAFDMAGGVLSQMPWLRHIAPDYTGFNLIKDMNIQLSKLLSDSIEEHKRTLQENKTRDFIDAFLHQMNISNGSPTTFTDDQLIMVCLDFFIAGSQTTRNTLSFALLNAMLHPEIQQRIHEEIDQELPNGKLPAFFTKSKFPYTEAFLWESQRFQHVVPIAGPRRVTEDTYIDGYLIPKGTTILINLNEFHHSCEKFKDPDAFRPERFLDAEGKFSPDRLYLFGYGKRRCLGETLAIKYIFLVFVGLLKHYELLPVPGKPLPTLEPIPGITLSPKPHSMLIKKRFQSKS
ncbi:cytochrome P450 305a1 [Lycorma delicatula]|uniref:cytochrome P450 305a1 n=1 Tax=Lycorma delicatula TaxID=130591 RepID=UPI003F512033